MSPEFMLVLAFLVGVGMSIGREATRSIANAWYMMRAPPPIDPRVIGRGPLPMFRPWKALSLAGPSDSLSSEQLKRLEKELQDLGLELEAEEARTSTYLLALSIAVDEDDTIELRLVPKWTTQVVGGGY